MPPRRTPQPAPRPWVGARQTADAALDTTWVFLDKVPPQHRLPPMLLPAGYAPPPPALQLPPPPPLVHRRAPSIELYSGRPMPPPEDMPRFAGWFAYQAAQTMSRAYGRLAGTLCSAVRVPGGAAALPRLTEAYPMLDGGAWDADGECAAPAGTVPLTRLLRWLDDGQAELLPATETERGTLAVLEALYSLQSPAASKWHRPFVRVVGSVVGVATAAADGVVVLIEWLVYVGRLLFELVADDAIRTMMQALTPAGRAPQATAGYDYTLAGLLKAAEHAGYPPWTAPLPASLSPSLVLLPFQAQTVQWMWDQEHQEGGLHASLWGTLRWRDGGSVHYFPAAGEFRIDAPPVVRGGLLAEEMGMGKTVEVLALIALHPRHPHAAAATTTTTTIWHDDAMDTPALARPPHAHPAHDAGDDARVGATLVVVPSTLLGQWIAETRKHAPGLSVRVVASRAQVQQGLHRVQPAGASAAAAPPSARAAAAAALADNLAALASDDLHELVQADMPGKAGQLRHGKRLTSVKWHRIVLDECQELRAATAAVAALCAKLDASYRWMVSGTPLIASLDDLHGELQFLQVWPFSLRLDGFWERKVRDPWVQRDPACLPLLRLLLAATTMRHTKSQRTLAGGSLVELPTLTVHYVPIIPTTTAEAYVWGYLEAYAAALATLIGVADEVGDHATLHLRTFVVPHYHGWVRLLLAALSHPANIDLTEMDVLKRHTEAAVDRLVHGLVHRATLTLNRALWQQVADACAMMPNRAPLPLSFPLHRSSTAAELLAGDHDGGGSASTAPDAPPAKLARMDTTGLTDHGMPVLSLVELMKRLQSPTASRMRTLNRNVARRMAIQTDRMVQLRTELESLSLAELRDRVRVQGMVDAGYARRAPYVEQLLWHARETERQPARADGETSTSRPRPSQGPDVDEIHAAGFEGLQLLADGRRLPCPICMSDITSPVVTLCVHMYCRMCALGMLNDAEVRRVRLQCAVCRRPLVRADLSVLDLGATAAAPPKDVRVLATQVRDAEVAEAEAAAAAAGAVVWHGLKLADAHRVNQHRLTTTHAAAGALFANTYAQPPGHGARPVESGPLSVPPVPFSETTKLPRATDLPAQHPWLNGLWPSVPSLTLEWMQHWHDVCHTVTGSKVEALLADMDAGRAADPTAKVVVFSQYDATLDALARALRVRGVGHALLQGQGQDRVQRQGALERFRQDPTCQALLLRVGLGAQGLTLTCAYTVYLCEPCPEAAAEAQAMNRVHRIGQTRPARCVVLYMERSAEERRLRARAAGRVGALATTTTVHDAPASADPDSLAVLQAASRSAAPATAPLHDAWLVGVRYGTM